MARRRPFLVLIVLSLWGLCSLPAGAQPAAPPAAQVEPGNGERQAWNMSLVGALRLDPYNRGVHGDVASYGHLAFVGKGRGACPGTGVDIIDVATPTAPRKLADTLDHANTSMEDMQVIRIGQRDVLAVGLQDCGGGRGGGLRGLELHDVTDPANPQQLSFFDTAPAGVHEFDLTTTPSGRVLALLATPDREVQTAGANGTGGSGDLLILDISEPTAPALAGEWGILDEPSLGPAAYSRARQGGIPQVYLHSARANADGTRAYLSYWDAGVMILDIADPARPVLLGRTTYAPGEEGNAHSVDEAAGGRVLIQADEDLSPYGLTVEVTTAGAAAQTYPAATASFAPRVGAGGGQPLAGDIVHVGRGCPAGTPEAPADGDPYAADPAGKIVLIERGLCSFDNKVARAQQAGARAVIIANTVAGDDLPPPMGGANPVAAGAPTVVGTRITIPVLSVGHGAGQAIRDRLAAGQPVTIDARQRFNGWGGLRFFDIADPARPAPLATFHTARSQSEAAAAGRGTWTVHNPEVWGSTLYASWYADGVRALDITNPAAPREIGFWTGGGAPAEAPPVTIWSVVPHGGLLLASDMNFGLYILRLDQGEPPADGAPAVPGGDVMDRPRGPARPSRY